MGSRFDDAAEQLIYEIRKLITHVPVTHGVGARLRVAVKSLEYQQIVVWMLANYGESWGRISNVRLIVEENPLSTELSVIFA